MKKYLLAVLASVFIVFSVIAQGPVFLFEKNSAKQVYAADRLQKALKETNNGKLPASIPFEIKFSINSELGKEAFSIKTEASAISITGGDETGLIYGSLSIAEDLRNGVPLKKIKAKAESSKLPFRAIKYDMPWDTYRHSYA